MFATAKSGDGLRFQNKFFVRTEIQFDVCRKILKLSENFEVVGKTRSPIKLDICLQ